jgi:competence protein ComEA
VLDPDRRHLIAYLAAAAVLVVLVARFVGHRAGSDPVPSISMAAPASASPRGARPRAAPPPPQLIWIDVEGAVRRPGLYSLPKGARVAAAVQRAGGLRSHANGAAVNLAAKLADGQQVFVPRRGEAGAAGSAAAPAPAGSPGPDGATAAPAGGAGGQQISLSSATQAQLEQLDGIGPALAGRIIQYREQHGGFRSVDELQQVSGIGQKRFDALKGSIVP